MLPYLNVVEVESALSVATSPPFSGFADLITLNNATWEGRICHAIKIGRGADPERVAVFFLGGVHAREWGTADILINFIEVLEGAYLKRAGVTFGAKTFTAKDIATIIETIDVVVFPQANPDGRHESMTGDPMWRKNKRTSAPNSLACAGVDINRNFDFLWNFPVEFSAAAMPPPASLDPCNENYHGPAPFSEPETLNVRTIFDTFPNISYFVDVHLHGEEIDYRWGDDESQSMDPSMNFQNIAYNGSRGVPSDAYAEYIPAEDQARSLDLAQTMSAAIKQVRGSNYTWNSGFSSVLLGLNTYPTSGASDDYAYSRHFVDSAKNNVISFTIECGNSNNPSPFHPPSSEMQQIIHEVTCGLIAFCLRVCEMENAMAWQITGNSATVPASNFIGTKDNQPVVVRTNNTEKLRVGADGRVGIGTAQPSARLSVVAPGAGEIAGTARSTTLLTSAGELGATAGSEVALATTGFTTGGNNVSLGVRALRTASGAGWTTTAVGLGMDVDNTVRAGANLWLHADGLVTIGTTDPFTGGRLIVEENTQFNAITGRAEGLGIAIAGVTEGTSPCILGSAVGASGVGVNGWATQSSTSVGVLGTTNGQLPPVMPSVTVPGGVGVLGESATGFGVLGVCDGGIGVVGTSSAGTGIGGHTAGAGNFNGVEGLCEAGTGAALHGLSNGANATALYAQNVAGGLAGSFLGDVQIGGTLTVSHKMFRIDHPLDPANKYLNHSSVESPEMTTVYSGNVVTDNDGMALVQMPAYFESLNRDFRYQLTVVGQFAQAIIEREIEGNSFIIRTDRPKVKVSWQVLGVRQDAYAQAHPIEVEQEKVGAERGRYIHPELYEAGAADPDRGRPIGWISSVMGQRQNIPEVRYRPYPEESFPRPKRKEVTDTQR